MTKPTITLTELVEKGADVDLLKQMIQFVTQRMMESMSKACTVPASTLEALTE